MATFTVDFLGCKVSQTDVQEIRERLVADGHVESGEAADIAVVNTCCVTHEAVRKSRRAARRAARTAGRVYVTGCGANLAGDALAGLPENVTIVRLPGERTPDFVARDVGAIGCVRADVGLDRVRAFVKVQDGCSFSCAFCVIPQVRGASRSRAAEAVLAEVRRRVAQGHREVVLTGINLGCFRDRSAGYDLARLVREVGAMPGIERVRLSSIEVNHLDEKLIAAMRETPAVSPHLHVPLQSGDDGVLTAMGRRYTSLHLPPPRCAGGGFQPDGGRDRRFPGRGRSRLRADARGRRRGWDHEGACLPLLAPARDAHRCCGHGHAAGQAGAERPAA